MSEVQSGQSSFALLRLLFRGLSFSRPVGHSLQSEQRELQQTGITHSNLQCHVHGGAFNNNQVGVCRHKDTAIYCSINIF